MCIQCDLPLLISGIEMIIIATRATIITTKDIDSMMDNDMMSRFEV